MAESKLNKVLKKLSVKLKWKVLKFQKFLRDNLDYQASVDSWNILNHIVWQFFPHAFVIGFVQKYFGNFLWSQAGGFPSLIMFWKIIHVHFYKKIYLCI